ncbi:MAG: DUF4426 domain-containing protein [Gammaproteobacteria bacterium]|nr:DUF4426 domain-containing protein [Gammaproteobacteria bacterium]
MKTTTTCLTAFLLLLAAFSASAENATRTGGYTIHHNALTTDSLPAQVATAYGLTRSKSRGLLNISVIRDEPGTMGTPVKAQIKAFARNLFGQMRTFDMREIIEDKAVYYIADFPVANRELMIFEFEVLPEGGRYPLRANMRHEFYTD